MKKMSFKTFCFRVLNLEMSTFHRELADLIQENRFVVVIAPRQHGKTELGTIAQALWRTYIAEKPELMLIVSNVDDQASKVISRVRDIIDTNPVLRATLRPESISKTKWVATEIFCKNGVKIISRGLSPKIRGLPVHHLMCDDILRDDPGSTGKTKKLFREIILPTINATKGTISVVGTPQSKVDLLHDLMSKDNGWAKAKYAAVILDSSGKWLKPLWESRYSLPELKNIQATMDSVSWSKEMMCNPVSGNASLYPWTLIESCIIEGLDASGIVKPNSTYYLGCDVAISDRGSADFSVFTVGEKEDDGPLKIVNVVREKGKSTEKQLSIIRDLDSKYGFNKVLVEQNGISYELANQVMKDAQLRTKALGFTTTNKNKIRILGAIEIAFRNKGLFVPKNETLVEELLNFGIREKEDGFGGRTQSYEGLGAHDDCVMSLALCLEASQSSFVRASLSIM